MRPFPKGCRNGKGIDFLLVPPGAFIAAAMELAMMEPADGNGKFVADLASHRSLLGKFDVMSVRRAPPADETRLRNHKPQMVAIAFAYRFADGKYPF
jgi:hypothetical protein